MDLNEMSKPKVSDELAAELALRIYGLQVISLKRMVSYDDQNFHILVSKEHQNPYIKDISEDGYTLKITNTAKSSEEGHFDFMHSTMVHVHNKGIRVPVPVMNVEGNTWKLEKVPLLNKDSEDVTDDKKCGIHLLTFLPGIPVSTVPYTTDVLYQWGRLLAQFHNAAKDFSYPGLLEKSIFWSLENVPVLRDLMEGMENDKRNLVLSVLERYPEEITKNIANVRKGILHGDFNENNVIVQKLENEDSENPSYSIDGILDFEDVHNGAYVWDLSAMLTYTLLECNLMDPVEGAGHALAGYMNLRSLDSLELSMIRICILCRLCQSLVIGAYSFRQDPGNTYCLISAKSGWTRLQQMLDTSNESLLQKWKEIQKFHNC